MDFTQEQHKAKGAGLCGELTMCVFFRRPRGLIHFTIWLANVLLLITVGRRTPRCVNFPPDCRNTEENFTVPMYPQNKAFKKMSAEQISGFHSDKRGYWGLIRRVANVIKTIRLHRKLTLFLK